jgi:predicted RND superfamily exporter protein
MRRPRLVVVGALLVTLVLAALIVRVEADTDPENMLRSDDPVRVLNRSMRDDFGTRDMLMLGIVDSEGTLSAETFNASARLIDDIKALDGTVAGGVVSFASAEAVPSEPISASDVDVIVGAVEANPLLAGRVISPDRSALAVFVPLESKDAANGAASAIDGLVEEHGLESGEYYLAGLPLAEEAFGRDMFIQMGLLAPLAGLLIFALMLYLFRRLALVVAAMIVAMLSVIWTMGLLIGTGFSLHIMSSMIPIFLMPIAILDSVHVLSEFFDRYPRYKDRRQTLRAVYKDLFLPITYTSLTTAVAFASLTIAPIPPVQVFGAFVAIGVVAAWLLTMLFLPAFVMLLSEQNLQRVQASSEGRGNRALASGVRRIGQLTARRPRWIAAGFALLVIAAIPGITQISVNDNPVRWFKSGTDIRQATEELNRLFAGTYNASLLLDTDQPGTLTQPETAAAVSKLQEFWESIDVIGQTTSYADALPAQIPPDQPDQAQIETSLSSTATLADAGGVSGLITPDYRKANLQLQMKDGDNQTMQRVIDDTDAYLDAQPLPQGIQTAWAGETYLNLVWQDKMVSGMLKAFLSTLGVVFLLMLLLFRSLRWALLAIVPLAVTILLVYGAAGLSGKAYDMPMAVLSTLVLGIGIDFSIHFSQRYRALRRTTESTRAALQQFFEEPARALTRNALIIAIGFLPLLFSSLVPYLIVGAFLTSIMILSWLATLLLLPALILLLGRRPARIS